MATENITVWHVITSPFKKGHEYGYYDMGIYSDIALAVAAAENLLNWMVGPEAVKATWTKRDNGAQVLIFPGGIDGDIYIGAVPRPLNKSPKDLKKARHIVYTERMD
jgi:hypothetical protein